MEFLCACHYNCAKLMCVTVGLIDLRQYKNTMGMLGRHIVLVFFEKLKHC